MIQIQKLEKIFYGIGEPITVLKDLDLDVIRYANADQATVETGVLEAVNNYSGRLQLGEGLIIARLINEIMDVGGVYNLKMKAPQQDVNVSVDQFLLFDQITITHRIKRRAYQDASIDGSLGDEAAATAQILDVNKETFSIE